MRYFFFLITVVLLSAKTVVAQVSTKVGKQSYAIKKLIRDHHYNNIAFDDERSVAIFDRLIQELDPYGQLFYASDITRLKNEYSTLIDDDIKNKTTVFFDDLATVFKERLTTANNIIDELKADKIDLEKDENITQANLNEASSYPADETALKEIWRKQLKADLLEELFSGDHHPNPLETTVDSVLSFQAEALNNVVRAAHYQFNTFLNHPSGYKTYLATFYLNAIATSIDPHTTYFSPTAHSDFIENLSKDNYAFGFSLDEDDKGNVVITSLTPGGAAWMSNKLNKGDVILKIQLGENSLDLSIAGLDEVNLLFQGTDEDELTLTIRKANGQEQEVFLEKAPIYVDQDVIKSVILDGEQRIGYITLPDFYTDWTDESVLGCANDVAKIIVKLEKENIDGLILDLRNNGGGSVKEAIDLAGIFINYGPLGIYQDQKREPLSIKDFNKGVIYSGPFAIMVNGLSASASEIFSAAMQDYKRALIVGSNTYGKSTGQVVLPLDPAYGTSIVDIDKADPSFGYLKVTKAKYYRITCTTHQLEGVQPDIALPDIYDIYDYRESQYSNALKKDSVKKKVYYTPFADLPTELLRQKSEQRLIDYPYGKALQYKVDSLRKAFDEQHTFPLQIEAYKKNQIDLENAIAELFQLVENESAVFDVVNNQYDLKIMEMNNYRSIINEAYLEQVKKDVYIDETYKILSDYINIESK